MTSQAEIMRAGLSALAKVGPLDRMLLDLKEKQTYLNILQSVANAGIHFDIKTVSILRSSIIETKTEIDSLKHRIDFLRAMPKSSGKTIKFRRYAYHPSMLEKKMPIKVEVKNESKHQEYPCLMRHSPSGAIVLLDSPTSGMVVAPSIGRFNENDPLGQICTGLYSSTWQKTAFVPWSGEVKLES